MVYITARCRKIHVVKLVFSGKTLQEGNLVPLFFLVRVNVPDGRATVIQWRMRTNPRRLQA